MCKRKLSNCNFSVPIGHYHTPTVRGVPHVLTHGGVKMAKIRIATTYHNGPQRIMKKNENCISLTDQIPSIATKISAGIRTNYDLAPSGLSGVSKRKKCGKKPNFGRFSKMRASVTYYFDSIMAYETHSFAYGITKLV